VAIGAAVKDPSSPQTSFSLLRDGASKALVNFFSIKP
jgi:hypothetical protein